MWKRTASTWVLKILVIFETLWSQLGFNFYIYKTKQINETVPSVILFFSIFWRRCHGISLAAFFISPTLLIQFYSKSKWWQTPFIFTCCKRYSLLSHEGNSLRKVFLGLSAKTSFNHTSLLWNQMSNTYLYFTCSKQAVPFGDGLFYV